MTANILKYDPQPRKCQLCGGKVEFIDNAKIYGGSFGSGKAYWCKGCGSYVGTHANAPTVALGVLADKAMRRKKKLCHAKFDYLWNWGEDKRSKRTACYAELAERLGIAVSECHFGYFDETLLDRALAEIEKMQDVFHTKHPTPFQRDFRIPRNRQP